MLLGLVLAAPTFGRGTILFACLVKVNRLFILAVVLHLWDLNAKARAWFDVIYTTPNCLQHRHRYAFVFRFIPPHSCLDMFELLSSNFGKAMQTSVNFYSSMWGQFMHINTSICYTSISGCAGNKFRRAFLTQSVINDITVTSWWD